MSKGKIIFRDRALQVNDFSNLVRHRGITPTDIDGYIDYNGQAFLFLEGKYMGADLPTGQRISFEHLVNKISAPAACIVFEHQTEIGQDVEVSACMVREYYYAGMWYKVNDFRTVIEQIENFEHFCTNHLKIQI